MPAGAGRPRWPWLSLIPLGLGAWAPIYAGVKARRPVWSALGVLSCAAALAGWVIVATGKDSGHNDAAGFLLILGWVSGAAISFSIRSAYERVIASPLLAAEQAGELRVHDRHHAREIAEHNPELAREMGIGRPDRPGADSEGLVDVNNASVTALLSLPGVDGNLATRLIETRERVNGFSSLEDMGSVMDLDGDLVEQLRDRALFLPRQGGHA